MMAPMIRCLITLWLATVSMAAMPRLEDDTTCLTPEREWFQPELHQQALLRFMYQTGEEVRRSVDCLDLFGASGRVKRTWEKAGYSASGYDIKLSKNHDICSLAGVKTLLVLGLQWLGMCLSNANRSIF